MIFRVFKLFSNKKAFAFLNSYKIITKKLFQQKGNIHLQILTCKY